MTAEAPASLSVARARQLTKKIREALQIADDLLVEAYRGRVWTALGHASWEAYCAAELPALRMIRLTVDERLERVAAMRGEGLSVSAIAAPLGVSKGTIAGDLDKLRKAGRIADDGATVVAIDGRRRQARAARPAPTPAPVRPVTKTVRTLDLIAAAGGRGLTVRELCEVSGWHHGQASGTLTALHAQGRIVRTGTRRDNCRAYVAAGA